MLTVFITTSGNDSRLSKFTYNTNKSLVQIGNKLTICYIIDKYDLTMTQFVITLGYFGDIVREFLNIAYENNNFIYVYVHNYDKEGSSMGYSMLQAKSYLQCPFMFYCCDSIVLDNIKINDDIKYDILFVAESNDADSYVSVTVNDEKIEEIYDKGYTKYDYVYTGVFYIYNYEQFWNELDYLYNSNKINKHLSDATVFKALCIKKNEFKYMILKEWYDIGNLKAYNNALEYLKCDYDILQKTNESICFLDNKVIKFFANKNVLKNIVLRGNMLYPKNPKILNHGEYFYSMEFVYGTLMSKLYQHNEIYNLLEWAKTNLWKNAKKDDNFRQKCLEFYKDKTLQRLDQLDILKQNKECNIINGIKTLSIKKMLKNLDWSFLCTDVFYNYHGDFILENIIKTSEGYKLIDWRQDFAGELSHGDMYYDLAKLRHNIILNYNNINKQLYTLDIIDDSVTLDLKCNYFLIEHLDSFDKFVINNHLNLKKIKILTAIIWLNMSPLHANISDFLFYFGKYNLELALKY